MRKRMRILLAACFLLCAAAAAGEENAPRNAVARPEEMTEAVSVETDGMPSVTADMLEEGMYEVVVDSSSSMFRVTGCALTVRDGRMTARLYMKSDAYSYMYAGTAEEAAASAPVNLIALGADERGRFFDLPVAALDDGVVCAAYSARKQVWYPRTLAFRSGSLPLSAFRPEALVTARSLELADGEYSAEVALTGAGRAKLASPARLTVKGGECRARVVFSTSKIDYLVLDGEKIFPETTEGGAAFDVPVAAFDRQISILADSTAIRPSTEVPYSLVFSSEGLR